MLYDWKSKSSGHSSIIYSSMLQHIWFSSTWITYSFKNWKAYVILLLWSDVFQMWFIILIKKYSTLSLIVLFVCFVCYPRSYHQLTKKPHCLCCSTTLITWSPIEHVIGPVLKLAPPPLLLICREMLFKKG